MTQALARQQHRADQAVGIVDSGDERMWGVGAMDEANGRASSRRIAAGL